MKQHPFRPARLLLAALVLFPSLATALAQTDAAAQAAQQPGTQTQPSSQQQRAQVLREAQARVQARRHIREQQIIQETYSHKFEAYFGGGYIRFRPGQHLQHDNESAWNAGVTEWIRPKLGITADFRGYYGVANAEDFEFQVFEPSISQYTFMAGPQYRFFEGQHWGWSAQVLAGVGHGNFGTGTNGFPATLVNLYPDGNVVNVSVGAAVDYNLSPNLAVRLMPNYLLTNYGSQIQENLGFTSAVVYRWGRR